MLYQGILQTVHFPKFDWVAYSQKVFVCDAYAELLS